MISWESDMLTPYVVNGRLGRAARNIINPQKLQIGVAPSEMPRAGKNPELQLRLLLTHQPLRDDDLSVIQ